MPGRHFFDVQERFAFLHKGDAPPPPPPPAPVARQPLDDPARAAEDERKRQANRKGYSRSVLADFAQDDAAAKKTVLG